MNDLPEGWRSAELGELIESAVDGPFGSNLKTEHYVDAPGVRVIRLQNLGIGDFIDDDRAFISEAHAAGLSRHEVRPGDLLIASLGDEAHPVARACRYPASGGAAIVKADCFRIRLFAKAADPGFVRNILNCASTREGLGGLSQGVTRDRVNLASLKHFRISLPPIDEQYRIVEILDTANEAIRSAERLIAKLEQAKQGLRHDLLTRGIDESGGLRDPATPCTFVNSELGLIPCDWRTVSVVDTASNSRSSLVIGPFGSDLIANDYRSSGVPVVFVRDVQPDDFSWVSDVYVSVQKAAQLSAHTVHPGDLVITKMGLPPAIAAVYPDGLPPGVVTADIIRLRPDVDAIDPAWLSLAINSNSTRRQIAAITGGVTRPKITLRDFRKMLIALPPRGEQKAISDRVQALTAEVAAVRRERDKLLLFKRGLMDDLLTGRVLVGVPS